MRIRFSLATLVAIVFGSSLTYVAYGQLPGRPPAGSPPAGARPTSGPTGAAPTTAPATSPRTTASNQGTNVAVVDINLIFKSHPRFKAKMDDIKKDIQGFETYVQDRQKKLQEEVAKMRDGNLKPSSQEYKNKEEALAREQTDMQLEMNRKKNEFLKQEARAYYDAYRDVEDVVKIVADKFGIDIVLRYSSEQIDPDQRDSVLKGVNRAIIFHRGLDITDPVMKQIGVRTASPGPGPIRNTVPR